MSYYTTSLPSFVLIARVMAVCGESSEVKVKEEVAVCIHDLTLDRGVIN